MINVLAPDQIFVFGSNRAGNHYGGAARQAFESFGAEWGVGEGMTGQCYALPTLDADMRVLTVPEINREAKKFLAHAERHPELIFLLTAVGCGIAGHKPADLAPLFDGGPLNVILPPEFEIELAKL